MRDQQKKSLDELMGGVVPSMDYHLRNRMYINEAGAYRLIMRSQMELAEEFQDWVTDTVLVSIRKHGKYEPNEQHTLPPPPPQPLSILDDRGLIDRSLYSSKCCYKMLSEDDLRHKVIDYLKKFYPNAMISSGLTESQGSTPERRIDAVINGYQCGHSDILITNRHINYTGLAIELKTPTGKGKLQDKQKSWLESKFLDQCLILVSNDYDVIIRAINEYFEKVRIACPFCVKGKTFYKTQASLNKHIQFFHTNKRVSVG